MAALKLYIEGKNAEQSAQVLQQFMAEQWALESSLRPQAPAKDPDTKDLATILTVMKIIIELPKFLDAVDDLARRMQAKERLEALIARVQALADPAQTFWIEVNGIPFALRTENLVDILNNIEE